jgi:hypothetical protein
VLDGSQDAERRAKEMLSWDVNNGVSINDWNINFCDFSSGEFHLLLYALQAVQQLLHLQDN